MAIVTDSWTTAEVSAAGSLECNLALDGISEFWLMKIRITPSASGGLSTYQLFSDDGFDGDLAWEATANALSPFYDPVKIDDDGNMSEEGAGIICYYVDEDASDEFHLKIANAAAVGRTYFVEIWYIEN